MRSSFIILVIALFGLALASVPTDGQFIFTDHKDAVCSETIAQTQLFKGSSSCWEKSSTTSIVPMDFNTTSMELTLRAYGSSSTCSGTDNKEGKVLCNNSCQQNPVNPNQKFVCNYLLLSNTGNFTLKSYTDKDCKTTSTGLKIFSSESFCWVTDTKMSLAPWKWNQPDLTVYPFPSSGSCLGVVSGGSSVMKCDGVTCFANPAKTSEYYTCTYASSSYLAMSLLMIFVMILAVF